ncbi:hypothetical protein G6514_008176 [Epicoccum nigrum]|nr:hypothetical protein G6514_008176 [Epicoccum nigrum]
MASQAELQLSGTEPEYALGELYRMCVTSFREYLQTFGSREPIDNTCTIEPLDEYGRFVTWGEQTRAYLPNYSRGSLDEYVQDHPTVKQVIKSTLQQLLKSFESATKIGLDPVVLDQKNNLTHINNYDTESDTDSDPDLPPALTDLMVYEEPLQSISQPPKVSKLASIIRDISEQIKLLYEASALLKRPSMAGRYLRSNTSDEFGDEILPEFMPFDVGHVREKLVEWYDHWASSNQEGYTGRVSSSAWTARADMQVPESLIYRLASSNIKRRKQLKYWLRRSDAPESTVMETKVEPQDESQNISQRLFGTKSDGGNGDFEGYVFDRSGI